MQSLKAKFGTPDCPPSVRKEKRIAKLMQSPFVADSLGVGKDSDVESDKTVDLTNCSEPTDNCESNFVGQREKRRIRGSNGVKVKAGNDPLVECAMKMMEQVTSLLKSMSQENTKDIQTLVRNEVRSALSDTNISIKELRTLLENATFHLSSRNKS